MKMAKTCETFDLLSKTLRIAFATERFAFINHSMKDSDLNIYYFAILWFDN